MMHHSILIVYIVLMDCLALAEGVAKIPSNLEWRTHNIDNFISDSKAKKGGTLIGSLPSFPLTLRQVGPDSNSYFRSYIDENDMAMVSIHPNTGEYIPELATHWAFDANGRTAYYRVDKRAKWSDGKPVTSEDYIFTINFHRSKQIHDPWSNQYYTDQIENIQAFKDKADNDIIAVTLADVKPDLLFHTNIVPTPSHFYKLDKNFIRNYNWKIKPNLGPYQISEIKKGKSITYKRKKNWWANYRLWFKHRFNFDKIILKVIRDTNTTFEYLKKGKVDYMLIHSSDFWYEKSNTKEFKNGYIHRLMAYNSQPRIDSVLTLNENVKIFKDQRVREALHYAINVEKVIKKILRGEKQRLQGISQGYVMYTNPKIRARVYDINKANSLLDAAGWTTRNKEGIRVKDGMTLSATISYGYAIASPVLVVFREEAKKAGFDLRLQLLDPSILWKIFKKRNHEIAMVNWSSPFRPQYFGKYHSENSHRAMSNNFSNTADPFLDKKIEAYRHSTSTNLRVKLAHEIQQIIHDRAIQIPLFVTPYYRLAFWGWIRFPEPPGTRETSTFEYFGTSSGGLMWEDVDAKRKLIEAKKRGIELRAVTIIDETYRVSAQSL